MLLFEFTTILPSKKLLKGCPPGIFTDSILRKIADKSIKETSFCKSAKSLFIEETSFCKRAINWTKKKIGNGESYGNRTKTTFDG